MCSTCQQHVSSCSTGAGAAWSFRFVWLCVQLVQLALMMNVCEACLKRLRPVVESLSQGGCGAAAPQITVALFQHALCHYFRGTFKSHGAAGSKHARAFEGLRHQIGLSTSSPASTKPGSASSHPEWMLQGTASAASSSQPLLQHQPDYQVPHATGFASTPKVLVQCPC